MKLVKSKLTLTVSVIVLFTVSTSVIVAFASESDENILNANKTAALIKEEKVQLEKLLKEEYPKHGKVYISPDEAPSEELPSGLSINVQDGSIVDISDFKTKFDKLSNEKKDEYLEWQKKGESHIGIFKRKLQEIIGELPADAKRITLPEVKDIVSNHDFKEAIAEIEKLHGVPDYIGGSGVTNKEYWLDNEGNSKIIVIVEQGQIYFEEGNQGELLN
ncbi:MAG: hypothetical protein ACQEXQ_17725 [Bacillota bacterium]